MRPAVRDCTHTYAVRRVVQTGLLRRFVGGDCKADPSDNDIITTLRHDVNPLRRQFLKLTPPKCEVGIDWPARLVKLRECLPAVACWRILALRYIVRGGGASLRTCPRTRRDIMSTAACTAATRSYK